MSKIFIIPEITGSSLECVTLKHPKDWSDCTFYYEQNQNSLFELCVQQNKFYSWFSDNDTVKDGNIYLVTPIDPLFLLIPFIYKNNEKYQNLFDILTENHISASHVGYLQNLYSLNVLKCIAEVKNFEDEIFIRFCKEKTLKWLNLKFENIKESLIKNGIGKNLFGFKVNNYSSGDSKLSEAEYKVLAFEMISDYICQDLEQLLREKLGIPDRNTLFASIEDKVVGNKRKLENDTKSDVEEENDHRIMETQTLKESNKKSKMTRTQRVLSKVDKSGMKNISSYFQKKNV